ncbi:MAG: hypothetical protein IM631_05200 [Cytophagales bacterium]|nr:hypothetical protein [Cytophagales bacterium]MCA6370778.1 hypothetical protein [Cytophagales bacterium]MCA6385940.1 hypothetical protein [Cytophagales bacterium]
MQHFNNMHEIVKKIEVLLSRDGIRELYIKNDYTIDGVQFVNNDTNMTPDEIAKRVDNGDLLIRPLKESCSIETITDQVKINSLFENHSGLTPEFFK